MNLGQEQKFKRPVLNGATFFISNFSVIVIKMYLYDSQYNAKRYFAGK